MRVRIWQHPLGGNWYVQQKFWWNLTWQYVESFSGDNARQRAKAYAERLLHPETEEIK